MSYFVGDDATITYPVSDTATPPGNLAFTPVVTAHASDDTTMPVVGAVWLGAPGAARELEVPLGQLTAGLWSLRLSIDGDTDLFLGNVVIQ